MTETQRIVDQYDRAMRGDAWHGDNVWVILGKIEPTQAFERPLAGAHTIWELVAHMKFWETEVLRRLQQAPAQSPELNFPAMPEPAAENWKQLLEEFHQSNQQFRNALLLLPDSQLNQPLSAPDKSIYVEAHGVIQHNLYHAGQIAILGKNLASSRVIGGL
jgi:hypothetical protein